MYVQYDNKSHGRKREKMPETAPSVWYFKAWYLRFDLRLHENLQGIPAYKTPRYNYKPFVQTIQYVSVLYS